MGRVKLESHCDIRELCTPSGATEDPPQWGGGKILRCDDIAHFVKRDIHC